MSNFFKASRQNSAALIAAAEQAYDWSGVLPAACLPGIAPLAGGAPPNAISFGSMSEKGMYRWDHSVSGFTWRPAPMPPCVNRSIPKPTRQGLSKCSPVVPTVLTPVFSSPPFKGVNG